MTHFSTMAFVTRLIKTKFWYLLAALLLLRFVFILIADLDMVGDEAYYWDWSRHPDWCYYSKPPMVAWLIGAATWALGDSMPVVRLPAVLLGGGFLIAYYFTAKAFYSSKAAAIALLLILATPANAISNLIMTIDPPLYFFWMVTLYFLYHALFKEDKSAWWLAGLFAALACLSKPSAITLPLLLGNYLLVHKQYRAQLRRNFLCFLLPVLLSFVPLIVWNARHDWIMLQHGQSHFVQDEVFSLPKRFSEFAGFLGLQLVLFSPVIFVLLVKTCAAALRHYSRLSAKESFLLWMGPIPLLVMLLLSMLQKVQGNWPIPFYFTTFLLLSGWLAHGLWPKWLKPALLTGYLMVLLAYITPFSISALGLSNTAFDPTYRLRQWQKLAMDVDNLRHHLFAKPANTFIWVDAHRYLVSELAFYLPDHPVVFRLAPRGKIESQYELWPGPTKYIGKDALVLSSNNPQQVSDRLRNAFEELVPVGTVTALQGSPRERHYYAYMGKRLLRETGD